MIRLQIREAEDSVPYYNNKQRSCRFGKIWEMAAEREARYLYDRGDKERIGKLKNRAG